METPHETTERKRLYWQRARWCNWIGVALGLCILTPFLVALFDRREPVHLYQGKFIPEIVIPGQTIVIIWEADELRSGCDGVFERRITERTTGKVHQFKREATIYHLVGPSGGRQTFSKDFTLPDAMTPGPAEYQTIGERWCNPVQKYLWPIPFKGPIVPFTVLEKPAPPPVVLLPSIGPSLQGFEPGAAPKAKAVRKRSQRK